MRSEDSIKLFGLNNLTIEAEIRQIERSHSVDLGHSKNTEKKIDQTYYPQFTERLRSEATRMSTNYAIFYCLENSIREMISQRLYEQHGEEWWSIAVPVDVKKNAEGSRKREIS